MKLFKRIGLFLLFGMIFFYISFSLFKGTRSLSDIPANKAFDDINFYKCVVDAYNKDNKTNVSYDTNLSDEQLNKVENLRCYDRNISSTKGIEKMVSLTQVNLAKNKIEDINLSKNILLSSLVIDTNKLTKLDVSNNTKLYELKVSANLLTELDVSKNTELTQLDIGLWSSTSNFSASGSGKGNLISEIDVSKNVKLKWLYLSNNKLTKIDVSKNVELDTLHLEENQLTELDVSNNIALKNLYVYNNQLTSLDVSKNLELTDLWVYSNKLTTLDITKNIKLSRLWVFSNQLTELDVSNNIALKNLYVHNNQLTSLDVTKNIELTELYVHINQLTTLNVSKNTALTELCVYNNQLTSLDVTKNIELENLYVNNNQLTSLDVSKNVKLNNLIIYRNDFSYDKYVYVGNEFKLNNMVKLPEHLNWNSPVWSVSNDNMIKFMDNDEVLTLNVGNISIKGIVSKEYEVINNINVVEITSDKYSIDNKSDMIVVDFESVSYEEFISNIDVPDDIIIKIFDGDNEVASGNVSLGMKVNVYYGDQILNTFDITDEYLIFDESLIVTNEYISNISVGTSVNDLLELIDTSGSVSVYNKNGSVITGDKLIGTGSKIKIVMKNKTIEYNLSVNGDVDGDGKLGLSDIMKISKYVYVDKNSLSDIYLVAADYNMDNKYNLQDIMKIANKIYKGGN